MGYNLPFQFYMQNKAENVNDDGLKVVVYQFFRISDVMSLPWKYKLLNLNVIFFSIIIVL